MIPLASLMLLLSKPRNITPGPPPRLPDAEYLDVGIIPSLQVTEVYYKDLQHVEENLNTTIDGVTFTVTNTGINPL